MAPKIVLSRLGDISWSLWDPIGLLGKDEIWDHQPFADEYDSYLIQAAGQLRRNASAKEVFNYLVHIETEHMGLGQWRGEKKRAKAVVEAIQADDQFWTNSSDK
jgi:hypothetical protein